MHVPVDFLVLLQVGLVALYIFRLKAAFLHLHGSLLNLQNVTGLTKKLPPFGADQPPCLCPCGPHTRSQSHGGHVGPVVGQGDGQVPPQGSSRIKDRVGGHRS